MKNYGGDDTAEKCAEPIDPIPAISVEPVFEFETRCGDGCGIYCSIERTGKCGDDEAADDVLVAIGRCEKREKFVHNVCLLNYYCYLCDVGGAFNPVRDTSPIPARVFTLAFLLILFFLCLCNKCT